MFTYMIKFAPEGSTLPSDVHIILITKSSMSEIFSSLLIYMTRYEQNNYRKLFLLTMESVHSKSKTL